jgi:WD40 repeat protein/serine/threonine protein kinase
MHPTAQQLALFGHGKLPSDLTATVAAHLEACPDCRRAVAELPADSFLGKVRAAHPEAATLPPDERLREDAGGGAALGDMPPELASHPKFRIVRRLGKGGMGVIYLAEHRVLQKPFALKVINPALLDNPDVLARFNAEARAAAQLDHPNIARCHDADQAGELHFLVMEYVEGMSLAQVLEKKGPLSVASACHCVCQAALGLQHALEHGMAHRDIKPQNLMLTPKGQVKVLDFGLARLRGERKDGGRLTQADSFMGTPEYVAPEQATDARSADIRADIYSLGCTLYALLTGRPPFQEDTMVKLVLAHIEREPRPLHELRPDVPPEVSAVAAKMLAKDPTQRYQRPVEVAQALAAFARARGAAPAPVPRDVGLATTPIIVGGDTSRLKGPDRGAIKPPAKGRATAKTRGSPFADLNDATARPEPAQPAKPGRRPTRVEWWKRPPVLAGGAVAVVVWLVLVGIWAKVRTADGSMLIVEVNEPNADVLVDKERVTVTWGDGGKRAEIALKPGSHRVMVTKEGFTVYGEQVDLQEGQRRILTATLKQAAPGQGGVVDNQAPNSATDARAVEFDLTGGYRFVHFAPDGPRVVLRLNDAEQREHFARVYNITTGQPVSPPMRHSATVGHASFSPDGRRVVTASSDGTARVWDATTGQPISPPLRHEHDVRHPSFSPDGKRVVTASHDKTARVWSVETGQPLSAPLKHDGVVWHAAFSPDGKRVATASSDGTARLWDAATGKPLSEPLKHEDTVWQASFSPDGSRLATASEDGTVRVWDGTTGKPLLQPLQPISGVGHVSFSPDGKRLVTANWRKTARVWDAATGQAISPPLTHNDDVRHATFSLDGKRVVTVGYDKTARVWDAVTGKELAPPLRHEDDVRYACFSPDGRRVLTASYDRTAHLWDADTGDELKKVVIAP